MELVYENGRWETISSFEEKDKIKDCGFFWDGAKRRWYTTKQNVAKKLLEFANEAARLQIEALEPKVEQRLPQEVQIRCPEGLTFYPYQIEGIKIASAQNATLIGDEMGLGKTAQAIGVINSTAPETVLIVCPATLKINWHRELTRWLTTAYKIDVLNAGDTFPKNPEIVVLNYDIASRYADQLRQTEWGLFVADEAHYLKNPGAQRTKALLGKGKKIPSISAKKKILLTGTPIPNRPIEAWPLLSFLWPQVFDNYFFYARRYCEARHNGYGWEVTGASNLAELQQNMKAAGLVRRLKSEVLTDLPPKTRQVVALPSETVSHLLKEEKDTVKRHEEKVTRLQRAKHAAKSQRDEEGYKNAVAQLREAQGVAFTEMARVRKELAVAKIPFCIEYIKMQLEENAKVVFMAHHRTVIDQIQEHFGTSAVKLYGGMTSEEKMKSVDAFQNDPNCSVFLGSIQAAGVGITLTSAQCMVFGELDWVPGNMLQAEDRIHRIGQTGNALIQQLVFDGSLDAKMAETLVRKMGVIEQALDFTEAEEEIDIF
jgi:SNF2 family DNA or RNA helicase